MPVQEKPTSSVSNRALAFSGLIGRSILLLPGLMLFAGEAPALIREMNVNVREVSTGTRSGRIVVERRVLTDLVSETAFEGTYFKVVHASDESPIRFDHPDSDVVRRAATVYYHMSNTRNALDTLELHDRSGLRKQMLIRIDQEQDFSDVHHFDPRPERREYNASRIIPPSDPFMLAGGVRPWGYEIWFRKASVEKRRSPLNLVAGQVNSREFKSMLMGQLLYSDMISLTQNALLGFFNPTDHLISMSFSIGLSELIPQTIGLIGRHSHQRYYLDSAMIPEIAVHEFSHIALAPVFGLKRSTALNEGFANYLAWRVTGLEKLGARAGAFNRSDAPKSALTRAKYSFDQEMLKQAAYGSFTFSLLHELDQAMGPEGGKILIHSLAYLNEDSSLNVDLPNAVKHAIEDIGTRKKAQWLSALGVFVKRGM